MSIKRYSLAIYQHDAEMQEDANGEYCLFTVMQALLTAETQRREAAEAVVDILLVPVVIADDLPELIQEAEGYRAKYPKETA